MWLGIVIGNVWCTKKVSALTGQTFLLVAPEGHQGPAWCAPIKRERAPATECW